MFYLVYACDYFFEGLHGMYEVAIVEGDEALVRDIGLEMSLNVIHSYSQIKKLIKEQLEEEREYGYTQEDLENDDVYCTSWELDPKKLPTEDIEELEEILQREGWELFLEKYKQRAE